MGMIAEEAEAVAKNSTRSLAKYATSAIPIMPMTATARAAGARR
jgi:hypothetical protein